MHLNRTSSEQLPYSKKKGPFLNRLDTWLVAYDVLIYLLYV